MILRLRSDSAPGMLASQIRQATHSTGMTASTSSIAPRRLGDAFFKRHAAWPLLAYLAVMVLLVPLRADLHLADAIYRWEGHGWTLHDNFIVQPLIHVLGKRLSTFAWYGVAITLIASFSLPRFRRWRLATALSTFVVGTLKLWTNMDCPWDLVRYGGTLPYFDLFAPRAAGLAPGRCFPAGHASAGYAWVALYFFFLATRPALRWWGLAAGLAVGLVFGIAQQLRGAHFLSHDITTLAICWTVSLVLYLMLRALTRPSRVESAAHTGPESARSLVEARS